MNVRAMKEGNNWIGILISSTLSATATLFLSTYEFQNNKSWEYGSSISRLDVEESNSSSRITTAETEITSINRTLNEISSSIQGLKDGIDTQTKALADLQKRFDGLDLIL